jgi:hypothetical protein
MEYESVTKIVFLFIESMPQNAKQLEHVHLSQYVRFQSGTHLPRNLLQHLLCNCFDRSSNITSILKLLYQTSDSII